jgi:hypothetical protein
MSIMKIQVQEMHIAERPYTFRPIYLVIIQI